MHMLELTVMLLCDRVVLFTLSYLVVLATGFLVSLHNNLYLWVT